MIYRLDEKEIWFPKPELADEDGLLAVGGDLSPERLLLAYSHGIFPWFSEETPILWYAPHERFVLFPDKIRISSSMKQVIRRKRFRITYDQNFPDVIRACASANRKDEPGTWITPDMIEAYIQLHEMGFAHSIEIWEGNKLAGGLYGVALNGVFCGESMFSQVSNASKMAMIALCENKKYRMIDCQMHTSHLESMGAEFISQKDYLTILQQA
ncbi:leucyl/phenylalanyl-tRNA--protein transferase [Daejeonella oryzae]|uniref:leucyl/phenylalanyl-tRNA--protein transferase n=1 Tax=Daejeonella oryzae TaxID=1122943 RepID=UPI00041890C1|nr:leucyl/phenylalanyl-tRNA--protein transferase [Daejeonella oryzae]